MPGAVTRYCGTMLCLLNKEGPWAGFVSFTLLESLFLYTLPLLERSTFSRQLPFTMSSSASGPSRRSERLQKKSVAKRSQKKPLANRLPVAKQKRPVAVASPTRTFPTLATMSDSSSLASVVRVKFRKWQKLDDEYPLALFHARFWGKSMEDEEEEW